VFYNIKWNGADLALLMILTEKQSDGNIYFMTKYGCDITSNGGEVQNRRLWFLKLKTSKYRTKKHGISKNLTNINNKDLSTGKFIRNFKLNQ
jgi:hypothetical protein